VTNESDADGSLGLASDARGDIRRAEASRVLGLLRAEGLAERAGGWLDGGVDTQNVRALVGSVDDPEISDGVRVALVAEIAAELGLGFTNLQEARALQAEEIIRSMSAGENMSPQIFDLSNGVTDEFAAKLMARLRRFFGGSDRRT
jgi:hypothetical protein